MFKTFGFSILLPLLDGADDGSGGGSPAPAISGTTPAAATPAAPAPQSATPAAPSAASPTPSTPPGEGWVPSYRLREAREAASREASQQYAQREAEYQNQLKQVQSQLHALVGVQQPQNPELDAVRQQFAKLYPNLAKLEERANDVFGVVDRAGDLESQTQHYWQSYGRQTMDRLFEHATSSMGAPLTEEGKRVLHSSFVGFVQSSPELTERYANDPTIVDDFLKMFTSSFVDPARRAAAATVQGRVVPSLPQDTPGGAVRPSQAPQPKDLDERAQGAWALYQQTKKA